jgi:hypothetical protein
MSVEISDGANFYSWFADASGNLQLSHRASEALPESSALSIGADGTVRAAAYSNVSDPSNTGYELMLVAPDGTLRRVPGQYANFQALVATSGIGNSPVDLATLQSTVTSLQSGYHTMQTQLAQVITTANTTAARVGTTDVVALAQTVNALQQTVNTLRGGNVVTPAPNDLALQVAIVEGIVFGALIIALFILYFRKR